MGKKKEEEKDYSWLREPAIEFVEHDFAKVQAERDALKLKVLELYAEIERLTGKPRCDF
jgi:hypothetical protein